MIRHSLKIWFIASLAVFAAGGAFAADSSTSYQGLKIEPIDNLIEEGAGHDADHVPETGEAYDDGHNPLEAATHSEVDHTEEAHHASAGMPQMDPTYFPSQIFWLAITFLCLYIIFSRKVLPEISGTLESRREKIEGDLDNAQKLKEAAENVHSEYDATLDAARAQSTELFVNAENNIKAITAEKMDAFKERATIENAKTEEIIAEAKALAMNDMHSIAAEIASVAAQKIVGISTDIDQARTLVKNLDRKAA